ncbi:methyltransferase [Umboniibacter marinipuniceus]|uniref:Methyltransferase family protein n=1 Tax=Umboniibacter marinipuniceus TaxID=569599 RepID=A0A3M0ABT3_9GAMM|nr:methyltransferase [Umboniibacter marinipuniceus]RMA82621.1 methyltransferase family protein [Umboniibacter marinipuniceus]
MTDFYESQAEELAAQYNAIAAPSVHDSWKDYWPTQDQPITALDVGAGTGRDAKWLAELGAEVYAVEPAQAMRAIGKQYTQYLNSTTHVTWLDDALPGLATTHQLGLRFDLILVSAVWMHIPKGERQRAFRKLTNLLAPNGKLVITLRHGEFTDGRTTHGVSVSELEAFAKHHGMLVKHVGTDGDQLKRGNVWWETVVLQLPDDGSGELLKVRHALVNDSKSATYKLALLRSLVRIADTHAGCVVDKSDGRVAIPLGLVALYWAKQYKKLLQFPIQKPVNANEVDPCHWGIQQATNTSRGLGFVKEGWRTLGHLQADDLHIGGVFLAEEAKAISSLLSDSAKTIKEMPVKHLWHKEKTNYLFEVNRRSVRKADSVVLDKTYFESFGEFILDESLWQCFKVFGSWIEPLIVNQWVALMQSYPLNAKRQLSQEHYRAALAWIDADHDTSQARKRADELRKDGYDLRSVWSGKLVSDNYHMDHCVPFAHWPSNDLWNLLPTTAKENLSKSDKVPSQAKLIKAKAQVISWWQDAWDNSSTKSTFMIQSAMALPGLSGEVNSFDEVYEAMTVQVRGVKDRLLVREWV